MRAIVRNDRGVELVSNHPDPVHESGEVLVRPHLVAVDRSDLAVAQGLLGFAGVLGQQFVGTVVKDHDGGWKDKRVVAAIASYCGTCDMCQAGLRDHCRQRTLLGMDGRDGCLADLVAISTGSLVAVPDDVDDDHAVFVHRVAAAVQAARQLTIEGKPYITVLGDGPLGLLTGQVMAKMNASVRLVGKHPEKLALCEKWGIKHRPLDDVGRRADQDVVVDCTGAANGLDVALTLVRPRGTIVVKTLLAPDEHRPSRDLSALIMKEITVIGSHAGPLAEGMRLLARREIDVVSLISRRMGLGDGAAVFQTVGRSEMLQVLVQV